MKGVELPEIMFLALDICSRDMAIVLSVFLLLVIFLRNSQFYRTPLDPHFLRTSATIYHVKVFLPQIWSLFRLPVQELIITPFSRET